VAQTLHNQYYRVVISAGLIFVPEFESTKTVFCNTIEALMQTPCKCIQLISLHPVVVTDWNMKWADLRQQYQSKLNTWYTEGMDWKKSMGTTWRFQSSRHRYLIHAKPRGTTTHIHPKLTRLSPHIKPHYTPDMYPQDGPQFHVQFNSNFLPNKIPHAKHYIS